MAVMGLRSLYFVLAGALQRLRLLRYGLSAVLVFVGVRMLLAGVVTVSAGTSLLVIVGLLAATVVGSLLMPARESVTSQ
jgi:tellurite resistance protein TerC